MNLIASLGLSILVLVSTPSFAKSIEGFYDQRLDWDSSSDARTFKQKYIVNSDFASGPDAPVIYYVGAEQALSSDVFENQSVGVLTRALGAHFVSLEHRYYGQSQPFKTLSGENLKYLKIDNALKDLAAFQRYWAKSKGLTGKWFAWGGSYGGALSAFYRSQYPDLVSGAISSSGSVRFETLSPDTDAFVAGVVGVDCVRAFRNQVLAPIEASVLNSESDPKKLAQFKHQFSADQMTDSMEFLQAIGTAAEFLIQETGPDQFCSAVESDRPIDEFILAYQKIYSAYSMSFLSLTFYGESGLNASAYSQGIGTRQWMYESCNEIGYFGSPGPDADHALLSFLPDYSQLNLNICNRLFGTRNLPDVTKQNSVFYEPLLDSDRTSKILFVNGSNDPVMAFSISPENGNASNANHLYTTIQDGFHCQDMDAPNSSDSQALKDARNFELKTLQEWL